MFRAFKYRLYPTKSQADMLSQWEGTTRWLWNQFLDRNVKQYAIDKKFVWLHELKRSIPSLKQQHSWIKQVPAHALQNIAFDMDKALKRSIKDLGFPKFKSKNKSNGSIKIDQVGSHIKISDTHITIPKLGEVKWKYHRSMNGKLKSISITKDCNDWYVSVLCEVEDPKSITIDRNKTVGIDLGISAFATLNDGTKISKPKHLAKKEARLKRYQRQVTKKKKGSNNRNKARCKLARLHQKIRFARGDWLHKTSHDLVKKYDLICLEDLKTKGLMTDKKKQRSLNKAISDQGWSMFIGMMKYKASFRGKHVTQIDQYAPSSKTCSHCGHKMEKMALDIRDWECPSCGHAHDRDVNAANNILVWGMLATQYHLFEKTSTDGASGINACGDTSTHVTQAIDWAHEVSLKQEAAISLESQ